MCMCAKIFDYLKENVNWISPLLITIIFSIINTIIAFFNYKNAKEQQKLQNNSFCFHLYDKRLKAYESIKEILADVISNGSVKTEDINNFLSKTKEVNFLFGDDIKETCSTIYELIINIHTNNKKIEYNMKHNIKDNTHNLLCNREIELFKSLTECSDALTEHINKYISFAKYTIN